MTHVTCRLTAKNRDQLWNHTLDNRVWATFTFFYCHTKQYYVQQGQWWEEVTYIGIGQSLQQQEQYCLEVLRQDVSVGVAYQTYQLRHGLLPLHRSTAAAAAVTQWHSDNYRPATTAQQSDSTRLDSVHSQQSRLTECCDWTAQWRCRQHSLW